jgi:hypothetical protein
VIYLCRIYRRTRIKTLRRYGPMVVCGLDICALFVSNSSTYTHMHHTAENGEKRPLASTSAKPRICRQAVSVQKCQMHLCKCLHVFVVLCKTL